MARPASQHPTDGELEILRVLWERGPSSLGDVCAALRRERDVATTTVATMLRVMLDKGLVRRKRAGRGHQWSAVVTHAAAARFDGRQAGGRHLRRLGPAARGPLGRRRTAFGRRAGRAAHAH